MKASIPHPTRYINYIIVVHGIGDQRPNETILPVINRFSEVRQNAEKPQRREVVTLGMITSQTGKPEEQAGHIRFTDCNPWAEFKSIPQEPHESLPPFLGEPSFMGENIRFVDMFWADIMEDEFGDVGQKVGTWAKSLLGRMEAKARPTDDGKFRGSTEEAWILPILYQLEETLIFLDNLLSFRFPFVEDLIFNKFLGDVQLYGEYHQIRGRATRRFHELFEKIEREHIQQFCPDSTFHDRYHNAAEGVDIVPKYTIISHSLGTVMAMDALLYAHVNKNIYKHPTKYSNLPFPGYADDHELVGEEHSHKAQQEAIIANHREFLGENWVSNVKSFVTLGSPIDKFLTIWWNNYLYLGGDKDGIAKRFDTIDQIFYKRGKEEKIKHYNYCDEQDPVGHRLDKFANKKVYDRIFQLEEDVVYNRYGTPGVAHVKYWEDIELFKRIVKVTVDEAPHGDINADMPDFHYKPNTYSWVMFYSYGLFQILAVLLLSFWGLWGWEGQEWTTSIIGSAGLIATVYMLRKFIKLNVWWRQALKYKNKVYEKSTYLAYKAYTMRLLMIGLQIALSLAVLAYLPAHIALSNITEADVIDYLGYFVDIAIMSFVGLVLHYLLYTKKRGAPDIKFYKTAEFYTFVYCSLLGITTAVFTYEEIRPLVEIAPYQALYKNVIAAALISSALVWTYTMACHTIARKTVRLAEGKR